MTGPSAHHIPPLVFSHPVTSPIPSRPCSLLAALVHVLTKDCRTEPCSTTRAVRTAASYRGPFEPPRTGRRHTEQVPAPVRNWESGSRRQPSQQQKATSQQPPRATPPPSQTPGRHGFLDSMGPVPRSRSGRTLRHPATSQLFLLLPTVGGGWLPLPRGLAALPPPEPRPGSLRENRTLGSLAGGDNKSAQ